MSQTSQQHNMFQSGNRQLSPHKPCAKFNEFYPLTLNCSQMLNVIYLYVFSPCLVQKTCPRTETPRQTAVSNLPPHLTASHTYGGQ